MSQDHTLDQQPPEHLRVWDVLPWIANGRATPAQQALVAAHLPHCADCREELAWQRRLCAAAAPAADEDAPDAEPGLNALLARLDASPAMPAHTRQAGAPRSGGRLVHFLAAAVVVQAVGLVALGWPFARTPDEAAYTTLTHAPHAAPATLRVLPSPSTTLAEWQALLAANGLQVVSGPNTAGAWGVAPAPGAAPRPLPEVVAALRAHPRVRLAEPVAPTASAP
jgi:hypothetical protein